MKKLVKKTLSIVLAVAVSMSSMALTVSAQEDTISTTTAAAADATMGTPMNLTEMGNYDWIHPYDGGVDRKVGVEERIQYDIITEPDSDSVVQWFANGPVYYSWTDGTPHKSDTDNRIGAVIQYMIDDPASTGHEITAPAGYALTVPASEWGQTLTVHAGVWAVRASVTVEVLGQEAPILVDILDDASQNDVNHIITVNIAPGDEVRVTMQYQEKYNAGGCIMLGAATLGVDADEAWYLMQLQSVADSLENLARDADDSAAMIMEKVAQIHALLDGTPTNEACKAMLEEMRTFYADVRDQVNGNLYTYQSDAKLTSSFGWEGDVDAPIAYLDGSYQLRNNGDKMITFGVMDIPGKIKWYNAEGYLPCFISEYSKNGVDYKIENFADKVEVNGNAYEIAYSRMTATNNAGKARNLPVVSADLVPLNEAAKSAAVIQAGETIVREYAIGADRFGGTYSYPTDEELQALGGFSEHYDHMKTYWNDRLAPLAEIKELPDESLINAYKAGYIYTLIIKDDVPQQDGSVNRELHVGENGYDRVFDHDIIGMMVGLMTLGDFEYFDDYSKTILMNVQYDDARWKFSWPFAYYLMKTGDTDYIRTRFEEIKTNARTIGTDRTGNGGIMKDTWAIDSQGSWTIDNWSSLMGLTAYYYICEQLGETEEANWAKAEYDSLFAAISTVIQKTVEENNLNYLPAAPDQPNTNNRCNDPMDGNWAAHLMFGRWGWDGYLFGAEQDGIMIDMIDDTYTYGLGRIEKELGEFQYTFGGYPGVSSAYNAGYASSGLRGEEYRDAGIKAYQYMINNTMSGPFGWWEGIKNSTTESAWEGAHSNNGTGSCQHMWGQSVATKVLFDSLIAEKSDGSVIIGRGIPAEWITESEGIEIDKYPVSGGKMGYRISVNGTTLTIAFTGDTNRVKSVELLGLKDNIVSAGDLGFDSAAGIVTVPANVSQVTVEMKKDPKEIVEWNNANESLTKAVAEAPDYSANASDYTKESYDAYAAALQNANALLANDGRTTEQMIAAAEALQAAVNNIKSIYITGTVDYTQGVLNNGFAFGDQYDQFKRYQTFIAPETLDCRSIDLLVGVGNEVTSDMTVEICTLQEDNKTIDQVIASTVVARADVLNGEIMNVPIEFSIEEGKAYAVALGKAEPGSVGTYVWYAYQGGVDGFGTETFFMKWNYFGDVEGVPSYGFIDESFLGHGWLRVNAVKYSKQALQDLVEEAKALHAEDYTAESWNYLQTVLEQSNDILQNSADVDQVVTAEAAMRRVIDNLHLAFPERILLKDTIDAAKIEKDHYREHLIPAVKEAFEKALAEAEAVYAKGDAATVEEVNAADEKLIRTMSYIAFTADKDGLKAAIDRANGLVSSGKYLDDNQMKAYRAAIAAAQELYDDPYVTDHEIAPAVQAMLEAEQKLNEAPPVSPLDLSKLEREVNISKSLNQNLYYDGEQKTTFQQKLAKAEEVLARAVANDPAVTQSMVDNALLELHAARGALRLIPNKEALQKLIEQANQLNEAEYTAESFAELKTALQSALAIYGDEQAEQSAINDAAELLQSAIRGLEKRSDNPSSEEPGKEEPGSKPSGGGSSSEKPSGGSSQTGDGTPMLPFALLMLLAGAGVVLLKRKVR